MKKGLFYTRTVGFVIACIALFAFSSEGANKKFYQGISRAHFRGFSGREDGVKAYFIKIDNIRNLENPGLVLLAKSIDIEGQAYVDVNGNRYDIPPIAGGLLGKIVIPVNIEHLKDGINEIAYFKKLGSDGYEVMDCRIESVDQGSAQVVGQTYRNIIPEWFQEFTLPTISDFDFVMGYKGENKRRESDVPEWTKRGKVRFYRARVDFEHLNRMFELSEFKKAHINLVAVCVPSNKDSKEFIKIKEFIERCHSNGIKVTSYQQIGLIRLRNVIMNPELKKWIDTDEYGRLRWSDSWGTYFADLKNKEYKNELLRTAEAAIDAGVDELYYDWTVAAPGVLIQFFSEVRKLTKKKGKNISIYGNCQGNILADGVCDIGKSEGLKEPGVWDGKWVHNVTQARFYYAAGDGWKPYRSKYQGGQHGTPNPGAYDVRDGMKCGWKRPTAEASAFQSHWAIAETGRKLSDGWALKNNKLALDIWNDICQYNEFLDKNKEFYTNVTTVSRVGLLAPPLIPPWGSQERMPLYNALAEMNVMYDALLLPRIDANTLARYKVIVIPDIPYVDERQLKVIEDYKKDGGKIYTIGSFRELKRLATIYSPPSMSREIGREATRDEFLNNLRKLLPEPLITLENAKYAIANVANKKGTDRIILHFVNYSKPVENIRVKVNLEGFVDRISKESIRLLSPDSVPQEIEAVSIEGTKIEFTIPKLDIYSIVAIN